MPVMVWDCGDTLAVKMEAREGDFHGLTSTTCLPSRRLAGEALEERSFYCGQDNITAGSASLNIF